MGMPCHTRTLARQQASEVIRGPIRMKQNPNPWAPASLRALAPLTWCNVHAATHACVQSRQASGMAGAKWGGNLFGVGFLLVLQLW